jgi:hypothetical protein
MYNAATSVNSEETLSLPAKIGPTTFQFGGESLYRPPITRLDAVYYWLTQPCILKGLNLLTHRREYVGAVLGGLTFSYHP